MAGFIGLILLGTLIFKVLELAGPKICAVFFTVYALLIGLLFVESASTIVYVTRVLAALIIIYPVSYIYFLLLHNYRGTWFYWILVVGGFVLPILL